MSEGIDPERENAARGRPIRANTFVSTQSDSSQRLAGSSPPGRLLREAPTKRVQAPNNRHVRARAVSPEIREKAWTQHDALLTADPDNL